MRSRFLTAVPACQQDIVARMRWKKRLASVMHGCLCWALSLATQPFLFKAGGMPFTIDKTAGRRRQREEPRANKVPKVRDLQSAGSTSSLREGVTCLAPPPTLQSPQPVLHPIFQVASHAVGCKAKAE